jgi:hypothetical protein
MGHYPDAIITPVHGVSRSPHTQRACQWLICVTLIGSFIVQYHIMLQYGFRAPVITEQYLTGVISRRRRGSARQPPYGHALHHIHVRRTSRQGTRHFLWQRKRTVRPVWSCSFEPNTVWRNFICHVSLIRAWLVMGCTTANRRFAPAICGSH